MIRHQMGQSISMHYLKPEKSKFQNGTKD